MKKILTCLFTSLVAISTLSAIAATDNNPNDFEFNNVPPLIQEYISSSKPMNLKKLKKIKKLMDKYHNDNAINDYTYNMISKRLNADIQTASLELRNPIDTINYGEANSGTPETSINTSKKINKVKFETKKEKNEKLIKQKEQTEAAKKEQETSDSK